MIKTNLKRFCFAVSGALFLGVPLLSEASLVFVSESGTHDPVFVLDSGDTSTDFIDLEFGLAIDAKLRYDVTNDIFNFNRDTNFGGNEIQNVRIENLAAAPTCDASTIGRMYFNTTNSNAYVCNGTVFEQIDIGAGISALALINDADGNTLVHTETNSNEDIIRFTTAGSERVRLESSGALNLLQNPAQNFVIESLASAPVAPVVGQVYFNTTDDEMYIYTSTGWQTIGHHALTHIDGTDDIPIATSTNKGLMSTAQFDELQTLIGQSDEINRNTVSDNLNLGTSINSGIAYLTYENPVDVSFVANIDDIEFIIPNNTAPGIALVAGTDTNPVLNYVYVRDTGVVESSTSDPEVGSFGYVPIAEVLVGTVSGSTGTIYYLENLTNFIRNFIRDVNSRLRSDGVIWLSGINPTTSGLDFAVTNGEVMHIHSVVSFPAQNTATGATMIDAYYNVYTQLDNTNYDDGSGGNVAIGNNKYHKLFIWGDKHGGLHMERQQKPPTSEYTSIQEAIDDPDEVVGSIPTEWKTVGFPIAYVIMSETTGPVQVIDLRSGAAGGGGGGGGHAQNTDIGTDNDSFVLDNDNTATSRVALVFGSTLSESLSWDVLGSRFVLSDNLRVDGSVGAVGRGYIAEDHVVADSDGTLNLGREAGVWENLTYDATVDDRFELSDDLSIDGALNFTGELIVNSNVGTTGQVLTSQGPGVAPTWETAPTGGGAGTASVFYAYDGAGGQVVNNTEVTLNIDSPVIVDSAYTLTADEVTISEAGLYRVVLQSSFTEFNTTGGQRTSVEMRLQENGVDLPGALTDCYVRETEENTCSLTVLENVAAGGVIRARILRTGGTTNLETLANASRLIIEKIR